MRTKSKKQKPNRKPKNPDSDIVWGAAAIGEVINKDERATFHLLQKRRLPVQQVGGMYAASRKKLLAYLGGAD